MSDFPTLCSLFVPTPVTIIRRTGQLFAGEGSNEFSRALLLRVVDEVVAMSELDPPDILRTGALCSRLPEQVRAIVYSGLIAPVVSIMRLEPMENATVVSTKIKGMLASAYAIPHETPGYVVGLMEYVHSDTVPAEHKA